MMDRSDGLGAGWARRTGIVALAGAVALAGLVLVSPSVDAATTTVRARKTNNGWGWRPKHVFIKRMDRIKWVNKTKKRHNIVAYGGNWNYRKGLPKNGGVRRRQFKRRGNFYYRCTLHSALSANQSRCRGQCGIIHVE